MTFDEYLENELSVTIYGFDPNGNSPRAVLLRMRNEGIFAAIKWESKEVIRELKWFFSSFEGRETPIAWFLNLLILPLSPLMPLFWTYTRYKSAMNDYKNSYKEYLQKLK